MTLDSVTAPKTIVNSVSNLTATIDSVNGYILAKNNGDNDDVSIISTNLPSLITCSSITLTLGTTVGNENKMLPAP